jgi:hypothetical protein
VSRSSFVGAASGAAKPRRASLAFASNEADIFNFFSRIDAGYVHSNPYHNALYVPQRRPVGLAVGRSVCACHHALCVLHWCRHGASVVFDVLYLLNTGDVGPLLTLEEKFAAVLAAAIHDFRHPGLNNGFLVASEHPLALRYNVRRRVWQRCVVDRMSCGAPPVAGCYMHVCVRVCVCVCVCVCACVTVG